MPIKVKVCATPGCPNLTDSTLCEECERERQRRVDAKRPSTHARGYGRRWQEIRRRYQRAHPVCEARGCSQPSTDVDHIVPREMGGSDDDFNLQALCHPHHSAKTARHDGGFGRARTKR